MGERLASVSFILTVSILYIMLLYVYLKIVDNTSTVSTISSNPVAVHLFICNETFYIQSSCVSWTNVQDSSDAGWTKEWICSW